MRLAIREYDRVLRLTALGATPTQSAHYLVQMAELVIRRAALIRGVVRLAEIGRLESIGGDEHALHQKRAHEMPQLARPIVGDQHELNDRLSVVYGQQIAVVSHERLHLSRKLLDQHISLVEHHIAKPLKVGPLVSEHSEQNERSRADQNVNSVRQRHVVLVIVAAGLQQQEFKLLYSGIFRSVLFVDSRGHVEYAPNDVVYALSSSTRGAQNEQQRPVVEPVYGVFDVAILERLDDRVLILELVEEETHERDNVGQVDVLLGHVVD